jgi:thymidylate synthase ThyX
MRVFVVDDQKPEVVAMLQALYSRSPQSVEVHLEQVKARGADKFMETYYVGYGHKSIGDCGTTSIFVENVSMLAAKAIQDTPLYSGQEASTRYLDMAKQPLVNPLGTQQGVDVQEVWMDLYLRALDALVPILRERFPRKPDEKESVWEKAIKAKAFDVARGLLPAGCTTYVAWHVNLRQAHDHLKELRNHPLDEVSRMAYEIQDALKARYPSSFGHGVTHEEENYLERSMERFAYYYSDITHFDHVDRLHHLNLDHFERETGLLSSRPPRTELHQRCRRFGHVDFQFPLDFGSFRDLQRQRSVVMEMPLLTTRLGFHPWYLDNLPPGFAELVNSATRVTDAMECDDVTRQCYVPMGFRVPVQMQCNLPAAVYVAELRSGQTVHPTLRSEAQNMGRVLERLLPAMALHVDFGPDAWSVKRGMQDIVKIRGAK